MSPKLRHLINKFARENFEFSTKKGAHWMCGEASEKFHYLCCDANIRSCVEDLMLDDDHDRYYCPKWYPNKANEDHTVVCVEKRIIDWTVRQYNPEAPFPLIYALPSPKKRAK